ncbi:uncharacterized protein [Hyperolius riggenbachi]|uniref:uncharacterized protein n=1 Tax=Hyperolius riggenbachi TaxID=752182 RepID=UPI0035A37D8F
MLLWSDVITLQVSLKKSYSSENCGTAMAGLGKMKWRRRCDRDKRKRMKGSEYYSYFLPVLMASLIPSTAGGATVTADLGDTVQLPCTFPFIQDGNNLLLLWERMDGNGKLLVHRFMEGQDDLSQQDPQYTGRTTLSRDLSQGNLALTLTAVTLRDGGTYYCRGANQIRDDSTAVTLSITVLEYVQTGSDITWCDMKCFDIISVLLLSRRCGGKKETLLKLICRTKYIDYLQPRLNLDTDSGCWTLPQAGREDSCVYEVWDRGAGDKVLSSTSICVLDPVLIYNISSNSSRLGEDIAVTVQFSGEECHVTWELDGGRLPERYRLIDDNRTLIIPSVQRDDAERTFRVRVTNPVSEEVRDYRLEIWDNQLNYNASDSSRITVLLIFTTVYLLINVFILCWVILRRYKSSHVTEAAPLKVMKYEHDMAV